MTAAASGFCRSRVRLRLLPFTDIQMGAILRSDHSRERAMLRTLEKAWFMGVVP